MRAGRLVTVAVAGVLAVGGLTACQADPTVAAYVGDVRITEAEVDAVVEHERDTGTAELDDALTRYERQLTDEGELTDDEITEELSSARADGADRLDERLTTLRTDVVTARVLTEAGQRYAADEGLTVPAPDLAAYADQLGLTPDHPAVPVIAEYQGVMEVLRTGLEPTAPSESDRREVYDNLVSQGLTGVPYEQVASLLTDERLGAAVAARDRLQQVLDRIDIQVNPRYQLVHRVEVQLGDGVTSWLKVAVGDPAVVEAA